MTLPSASWRNEWKPFLVRVEGHPVADVGVIRRIILEAGDLAVDVEQPRLGRLVVAGIDFGADRHRTDRLEDLAAVHETHLVACDVDVDPVAAGRRFDRRRLGRQRHGWNRLHHGGHGRGRRDEVGRSRRCLEAAGRGWGNRLDFDPGREGLLTVAAAACNQEQQDGEQDEEPYTYHGSTIPRPPGANNRDNVTEADRPGAAICDSTATQRQSRRNLTGIWPAHTAFASIARQEVQPMRLHPPVSQDEALKWLSAQASLTWGDEKATAMAADLDILAEAMAIISAIELPDDLEPLFP